VVVTEFSAAHIDFLGRTVLCHGADLCLVGRSQLLLPFAN
jgi:hypothetical protein